MSKCQFYWGYTLIPQGRGNVVVRGGGGGSGGGSEGGGGGEGSMTDCLCV